MPVCPRRASGLVAAAVVLALAAHALAEEAIVALRGRDERGLRRLLAAQQDPASPDYRRWLTTAEFGRRFGAAPRERRRVERWLRGSGCRVKRFAGRQQVACVGGAPGAVPADVARLVDDVLDPAAPLEVRTRVAGTGELRSLSPAGRFFFSPAEYAAYYGLDALHAAGIDGRDQRIGIVGLARVDPAGQATFRRTFGLPPLDLEQIGTPGPPSARRDVQIEAILDVAWAGAIAPGAGVTLAISRAGLVDAIIELVNRDDVAVLSLSVVLVPSPHARPFIRQALRLFRQAAAQGQTILVASGDFGPLLTLSPRKRGVDPFASSPWITAVGGTTPETPDPANAVSYAGEVVWQDGDAASGGGRSRVRRPRWQRGGATRTVPDVSLPAASVHPIPLDGGIACCVGGTSAGAPAWAGLAAMLNQQRGRRVGLLNPALYALGRAQAAGGPAVFNDVVRGSSSTTLARGFPARPGYDLATGWGSPSGVPLFAAFP